MTKFYIVAVLYMHLSSGRTYEEPHPTAMLYNTVMECERDRIKFFGHEKPPAGYSYCKTFQTYDKH